MCSTRRYRAASPPPGCPRRRRRRRGPAVACAGSPSAACLAVASAPRRPRNRRRRRWPPGRAGTVAAAAAAAAGAAGAAAAGAGTAAGAGPAAAAAAGPRSASVSGGAAASCRPPPPPPRCRHRRCRYPSPGCPRSRRPPRPRCSASSSLTAEGAAQGTRRHRRAQGAMGTWRRRAHVPGRMPAGRAGASLAPAPPACLTWGRTDTYGVGPRPGLGALPDAAAAAERHRQRPAGRRGLSCNTEVSPGGYGSSSLHSGPRAPPRTDTDTGRGPPPPLLSAAPGGAAGSGQAGPPPGEISGVLRGSDPGSPAWQGPHVLGPFPRRRCPGALSRPQHRRARVTHAPGGTRTQPGGARRMRDAGSGRGRGNAPRQSCAAPPPSPACPRAAPLSRDFTGPPSVPGASRGDCAVGSAGSGRGWFRARASKMALGVGWRVPAGFAHRAPYFSLSRRSLGAIGRNRCTRSFT